MKYFISIIITIFLFSCTDTSKNSNDTELNKEIENEELNNVDELLKRDKEKLDSMEQVFKKQAEAIKAD